MSELKKNLNLSQIISLYIGAVLGSGVLFLPGLAANMSGPLSIVSWIVISLAAIPLAMTMGLLSALFPSSGGVSHFVRTAFGNTYGTVIGWMFLLSVPTGVPIIALTGSSYFGQLWGWNEHQVVLGAAAILFVVLAMNYVGLKTVGLVQTLVVGAILLVLVIAIISAFPHASLDQFKPFAPHGYFVSIKTAGILFWCYIGWESVTHLSGEFNRPDRDALRGVLWSAGIVSVLYITLAVMVIATHSYGNGMSETGLSHMAQLTFGKAGAIGVSVTALFIAVASSSAYVSAGSRVAFSLASQNAAPKWFGRVHRKYSTPSGGLGFIAIIFVFILLGVYSGLLTINTLLPFPNATYFATYIGGAAAGVKLLNGHRIGKLASLLSLCITLGFFPFLGWVALYPVAVVAIVMIWNKNVPLGNSGKRAA